MKKYIEENTHGDYGGKQMNNNAETFINDWVIEEWNKTDKLRVYGVDEGEKIKVSRRLWLWRKKMNNNFIQWLQEQKYYIIWMSFSLKDWREINFESWSWEEIKAYYNSDPDNLYKLLNKKIKLNKEIKFKE